MKLFIPCECGYGLATRNNSDLSHFALTGYLYGEEYVGKGCCVGMLVPNQVVKVKWVGANRKILESHGHVYTKQYDEIEIPIEHLSEKSHMKIRINCDWCGGEKQKRRVDIDLNGNHFCNAKCYGQWLKHSDEAKLIHEKRATSIVTKCKLCGEKFKKKPSEFVGHGEHYCSRSCMGKDKMEKNNPNPKKEKIIVECDCCGVKFKVHESITKINKWHFCSRECYAQYRSENLIGDKVHNFQGLKTNCEICDKEFKTSKWHIENNSNRFCSQECYYTHRSLNYSGENHPQYGTVKSPEQIEKMRLITASRIANGDFPQTNTSIQIKVKEIVDKLNLYFQEEIQFKYYVLDFYDEVNNLAIEVMGDYWHANPIKFYDYELLHDIQKKDIKRDKSKKTYLKKYYDIDVLYLWEKDINENPDLCERLIQLYIDNKGALIDYNSYNYNIENEKIILKSDITQPFFMRANTIYQTC